MDSTIDSYKVEVEQLKLCCTAESEAESELQNLNTAKKGRKRRSLDHPGHSFLEATTHRAKKHSKPDDEFLAKVSTTNIVPFGIKFRIERSAE